MARAARPPSPADVLRQHFTAVSALIGSGAGEAEINAALTRAEGAGLDRTALRMAVREGRIANKERRAEVAVALDVYRALLNPPPALAGLAPPPLTGQPVRHRGPRGGQLR